MNHTVPLVLSLPQSTTGQPSRAESAVTSSALLANAISKSITNEPDLVATPMSGESSRTFGSVVGAAASVRPNSLSVPSVASVSTSLASGTGAPSQQMNAPTDYLRFSEWIGSPRSWVTDDVSAISPHTAYRIVRLIPALRSTGGRDPSSSHAADEGLEAAPTHTSLNVLGVPTPDHDGSGVDRSGAAHAPLRGSFRARRRLAAVVRQVGRPTSTRARSHCYVIDVP